MTNPQSICYLQLAIEKICVYIGLQLMLKIGALPSLGFSDLNYAPSSQKLNSVFLNYLWGAWGCDMVIMKVLL